MQRGKNRRKLPEVTGGPESGDGERPDDQARYKPPPRHTCNAECERAVSTIMAEAEEFYRRWRQ